AELDAEPVERDHPHAENLVPGWVEAGRLEVDRQQVQLGDEPVPGGPAPSPPHDRLSSGSRCPSACCALRTIRKASRRWRRSKSVSWPGSTKLSGSCPIR